MPDTDSFFSSVAGLPLHPLVVHFAVVLLPLSALALVVLVLVPRWARRFGVVTVAGLAVGTAAAFIAKQSGEALAATVGEPATHAAWGDQLPVLALVLLVLAAGWLVLQLRTPVGMRTPLSVRLVGGLTALAALAVTVLTVLVGHSGAQAAWGDTLSTPASTSVAVPGDDATPTSNPPTPTPTPTPSTSTPAASGYSLAEVAKHANAKSCWTVVDGNVYDVTDWVQRHPGGPRAILRMCGRDATSDFTDQHGGQSRPERELASFRLGPVAG